jgi:hypothetical protein
MSQQSVLILHYQNMHKKVFRYRAQRTHPVDASLDLPSLRQVVKRTVEKEEKIKTSPTLFTACGREGERSA